MRGARAGARPTGRARRAVSLWLLGTQEAFAVAYTDFAVTGYVYDVGSGSLREVA